MKIPKIIHYCWFGNNSKPNTIKKCLESWNILNEYEIIEWNEKNFDINCNKYVKEAYENKKYAFVSDYVRLKVLFEYGGIYLDTDVEVKKVFDDLLNNELFLGFMYDSLIGTAVIGSKKNNLIIKELLNQYNNKTLIYEANNGFFTKYLLDKFSEFRLNNKTQELDKGIMIYPKEFFERPSLGGKKNYCVHHYTGTWKEERNSYIKSIIKKILPNYIYRYITHKNALKYTPYYDIYLQHNKK